jgi:CBS domain-containing protein
VEPQRGKVSSAEAPTADTVLIPRAGSGLLGRRVLDLASTPPLTCPLSATIAAAAAQMSARAAGSIVVVGDLGEPLGIVTDRDLRNRVVARGASAEVPVAQIMSAPLVSVPADTPAFEALLEMTRRSIHHLGVVEGGRLVAIVSSHDMVLAEGAHPLALARAIEAEESLDGLAASAPRLIAVVRWLVTGGAGASEIGRLVAEINDRLVARALALIERALEVEGHGRPPVAYSWLVTGSEGRREQTLKTDQDNALIYADSPKDGEAAVYFSLLAERMGAALVRLGFPACPGGFMASNARWCQPERVWHEYFASWMENPNPEPIVDASLFFDLRPVAGDPEPGRALWSWVCERAPKRTLFLRYLAQDAVSQPSALGWFRRFRVERSGPRRGRLDLKAVAVFPMTQAMRVCGLSLGLRETHTLDRLAGAEAAGLLRPQDAADLREAYEIVTRMRIAHQLRCLDEGIAPDNFLDPRRLSRGDGLLLKHALRTVAWVQRFVEDRFQTDTLA